jgi:DNA-binding MarR family transcriptional regulator
LAPGQAAFTVPGPREQIETIQDVDLAVVASDLEWLRRVVPSRRWQGLRAGVFRQQLADAALWYWDNVLAGLWRRIEAIAQADRTYRSAIAADRGIAAALETVSPYLSVRGHTLVASGTATVSAPRMRYWTPGRGVWVVPTVLRAPRLSVGVPGGLPIISYGTRGAGRLWERGVAASRSLETLLGRTRANVLTALRVPGYTTALARDLDLPPSTVSDHLAALEGSGLLRSWREGRRMVYGLTELGERLLASSDEPRRRQAVPSRRGPRR